MKKSTFIILLIALIGNIQIAFAQDGWFGRCGAGIGSDVNTSNTGKFAAMEFGTNYKGLEVSLSLTYYDSSFDDYQTGHISYLSYDNTTICTSSATGNFEHTNNALVDLSVGYDVLRFFDVERHHLTPFVSYGCCQQSISSYGENVDEQATLKELNVTNQFDKEFSFGARYEFDINNRFSIGAFYKECTQMQEGHLIGATLKCYFE